MENLSAIFCLMLVSSTVFAQNVVLKCSAVHAGASDYQILSRDALPKVDLQVRVSERSFTSPSGRYTLEFAPLQQAADGKDWWRQAEVILKDTATGRELMRVSNKDLEKSPTADTLFGVHSSLTVEWDQNEKYIFLNDGYSNQIIDTQNASLIALGHGESFGLKGSNMYPRFIGMMGEGDLAILSYGYFQGFRVVNIQTHQTVFDTLPAAKKMSLFEKLNVNGLGVENAMQERYFSQMKGRPGAGFVPNTPLSYLHNPINNGIAFNSNGKFSLENKGSGILERRNLFVANGKVISSQPLEINLAKDLNMESGTEMISHTSIIASPKSSKFYALVSIMGDFRTIGGGDVPGSLRHVLFEIDSINGKAQKLWSASQPGPRFYSESSTEYNWSAMRINKGSKEKYQAPQTSNLPRYDLSTQYSYVYPVVSADGGKVMILGRDSHDGNAPAGLLTEVDLK